MICFRHGDNGNYLYFSTTALKLSNSDPNIDAENLGNSTLVAYLVISLVLIIGYIVDGREFIQESILEVRFKVQIENRYERNHLFVSANLEFYRHLHVHGQWGGGHHDLAGGDQGQGDQLLHAH